MTLEKNKTENSAELEVAFAPLREYLNGEMTAEELLEEYRVAYARLSERVEYLEERSEELRATTERQRFQLDCAHDHEKQLEETLNNVAGSTCWKMTWPIRYAMSKSRSLVHALPFLRWMQETKQLGVKGLLKQRQEKRLFRRAFSGRSVPAEKLAPWSLLLRQHREQPCATKISIVVPLYNTPIPYLTELIDSVVNQSYLLWELCMVDAGTEKAVEDYVRRRMAEEPRIRYQKLEKNEGIAGNTNRGFAMAEGDYIALLDHDDILHPCALWYVAEQIVQKKADFIYTDEATFEGDVEKPVLYHFKPDFMLDNLRSNNYICHLSVFQRTLLTRVGGGERSEFEGAQDYDLFLRMSEAASCIAHVPHALYYWRSSPTSTASNIAIKSYCIDSAIRALKAHYERVNVSVDKVSLIPETPGYYKTDYTLLPNKMVSILIPSYDHVEDLRKCIDSIYHKTTYQNFEIIIIENNSKEERTFRYYERLQRKYANLKVVVWQGTGFNFSALNNFGARYAKGDYLLMLNNDIEVINPTWLEEMVMYAQQERIGCVGAKLIYPDETIQHAGVGLGIGGVAGHLHKYYRRSDHGYMGRLDYVQDVSCVTAACLLIRRSIFDKVGGLDESFAVAFNDVDFCVRVWKAGYQNLFTPFAQLYHYESKSRGLEDNPEKQRRFQSEVLRFQKRWGDVLAMGDPCTNPNFDIMREDFSLKIKPLE